MHADSDNIVVGPIYLPATGRTIYGSFNSSTCTVPDMQGWVRWCDNYATASGIDTTHFTQRILLLPPNSPCGAIAQGMQNCISRGADGTCFLYAKLQKGGIPMPTLLHEMGHNLGLSHAAMYGCDPNGFDQGDTSCLM